MIAIVRYLSLEFHVLFIVMMRNFFGLLFVVPQFLQKHSPSLKTNKLGLHFFRGIAALISMITSFLAIAELPLAEAASLSFIGPILTTVAAIFLLKEKVSSRTWIATFCGAIGVLIILRPGFREFNPAYFYVFISVIFWAISNILIKLLTKTENSQSMVIYMSLVMLIFSIPLAIPYFESVDFEDLFWFVMLGIFSNLTQTYISLSYRRSDLAVVQPFYFTRLIFVSVISYLAFDEKIDIWVVVGSLVILGGVIAGSSKLKLK